MDHKEPVAAQSRQLLRPRAAGTEMPSVEQHPHIAAVHGFQDLRALREGLHGAAWHGHKFQRQPHAVVRRGVREPQQRIGGLAADRRRGDPLRHVEGRDDLHAVAAEHAAGRKAPVAQLAQHPPASLGLKGNALKRVQTRRADVLLLQRLPQRLQRPAAAQIAQERALAQLHGGKARLCAKRDVLRQCAVFHHGHFIEAKLHFLALLCFSEILRGGPRPHASRSARSTARCCVFYFLRHTRSARTSAAAPSDFSSHHTIFSRLCQESGRRGMHFVPQKHTFQADCSHPLKYCGMLYFVKLSGNRSFPLEFWNKDASRFYFLTGFPVQHGRSTADF